MKTSLKQYIKAFKSDPRNERLVNESRAGRLLSGVMKTLREESRLTQTQLAARLGRPQSFVAKLELGGYERCNVATLTTVARSMGFELDFECMFKKISAPVYSHDVECEFDSEFEKVEENLYREFAKAKSVTNGFTKAQLMAIAFDSSPEEARAA